MSNLNNNIESFASGMTQALSDKAQSVSNSLETVAQNLGSDIGKMTVNISEKSNDCVKSTRGYIAKNPLQSVAIAATAGLIFGSLYRIISRKT